MKVQCSECAGKGEIQREFRMNTVLAYFRTDKNGIPWEVCKTCEGMGYIDDQCDLPQDVMVKPRLEVHIRAKVRMEE